MSQLVDYKTALDSLGLHTLPLESVEDLQRKLIYLQDFKGIVQKGNYSSDEDNLNVSEDEGSDIAETTSSEDFFESEPEIECDVLDDSKILSNLVASKVITGCHLMATCLNNPENNSKKKIKLSPALRRDLIIPSALSSLQHCWIENKPISNSSFEFITNPFKLCIIKDLLENIGFLEEFRQDLYDLTFNIRTMDLYEFFQSKDLKFLTSSEKVKTIYEFLENDLMKWVATITGYDLTHISATCSLYSNTDYLLVHDDQREDRMIAFILYLTDQNGWHKDDGGTLQMFSKDENGQPFETVRDIVPVHNQLIFFPVTNDSYHQVAEVTSLSKYRLSINGWFHTKKPPIFTSPAYFPPEDGLYSRNVVKSKIVDINLESWINEDYLETNSIKLIQKHVEENSEISLKHFFKKESFDEILHNLRNQDINWKKVGPINRFSYAVADLTKIPHVLERFLDLFQSKLMFNLLQRYTDLDLDTENASMKFELQKWTPGNYALLPEYDWKEKNELDLIIYFGCQSSSDIVGARTYYVTTEDEVQNALITIDPEENNLNIVYRDSARFTRYFSKQSKCNGFYTLVCSYSE